VYKKSPSQGYLHTAVTAGSGKGTEEFAASHFKGLLQKPTEVESHSPTTRQQRAGAS